MRREAEAEAGRAEKKNGEAKPKEKTEAFCFEEYVDIVCKLVVIGLPFVDGVSHKKLAARKDVPQPNLSLHTQLTNSKEVSYDEKKQEEGIEVCSGWRSMTE